MQFLLTIQNVYWFRHVLDLLILALDFNCWKNPRQIGMLLEYSKYRSFRWWAEHIYLCLECKLQNKIIENNFLLLNNKKFIHHLSNMSIEYFDIKRGVPTQNHKNKFYHVVLSTWLIYMCFQQQDWKVWAIQGIVVS